MRKFAAIMAALALSVSAAACGSDESREDADDVRNGRIEKSEPNVTAFNNHYPNIEHKCLYSRPEANVVGGPLEKGVGEGIGLRVFVTSSKTVLIVADPHCPGYLPEQAGTTAGVGAEH